MLTRRLVLAAPALLLMAARPELSLEAVDSGLRESFLAWPGGAVFTCPATRARLVAVLAMGSLATPFSVAIVSFGLNALGAKQDWLAFVDAQGRLLALELADFQGAGTLTTRPAMLADRTHIVLERNAARHAATAHGATWRREAWTDYLRLERGRLVNAPQRLVLPGTWQNALIAPRAAMAALLSPPPIGIPADVLQCAQSMQSPFVAGA